MVSMPLSVSDDSAFYGRRRVFQAVQRQLRPQSSNHRRRAPDAHLRRNSLPSCHRRGTQIFEFCGLHSAKWQRIVSGSESLIVGLVFLFCLDACGSEERTSFM